MSSEKFEEAEDEYKSYFEELKNLVNNRLPKLSAEPRKREIRNAEKLYEDADLQISQMVDEAQQAPGVYKTRLMTKTRQYRAELNKLRRDLVKISSASVVSSSGGGGMRDDLLGGTAKPRDLNVRYDIQQQNRIREGLESLDRGSQSVARSQRIAAETDEIGVQIIGDLDDQRESLERTKDKLHQTDADLGRSRRILNSMAIRLATNKLLLAVIIVVEMAILAGVVYLKFFKNKK